MEQAIKIVSNKAEWNTAEIKTDCLIESWQESVWAQFELLWWAGHWLSCQLRQVLILTVSIGLSAQHDFLSDFLAQPIAETTHCANWWKISETAFNILTMLAQKSPVILNSFLCIILLSNYNCEMLLLVIISSEWQMFIVTPLLLLLARYYWLY